jgi:hypothetical protein
MDAQLSFSSLDFASKKKRTKRDVFLAEMAAVVPWLMLKGKSPAARHRLARNLVNYPCSRPSPSRNRVDQSFPSWRPYRQMNGRSKRTCDLTSSIVPRGTSFHRTVDLGFSPIAFDLEGLSCCCDFLGPPELGAVNPYAMHVTASRRASATIAFSSRGFW